MEKDLNKVSAHPFGHRDTRKVKNASATGDRWLAGKRAPPSLRNIYFMRLARSDPEAALGGPGSKPNHLSKLSKDCFEKYGLTKFFRPGPLPPSLVTPKMG